MRTKEIRKWIDEGGSLPQDLTQEEKDHLTKLGWSVKRQWYDSGEKWYEERCLHGKPHGKQEAWHANGQKAHERHCLHGKTHGKAEGWCDNGQKRYERHFLHGILHGVFKEWNRYGNLLTEEEYFYGNKIKETS